MTTRWVVRLEVTTDDAVDMTNVLSRLRLELDRLGTEELPECTTVDGGPVFGRRIWWGLAVLIPQGERPIQKVGKDWQRFLARAAE